MGVIALSVGVCVALAVMRSNGLTSVTVTALDPQAEPRDHDLPLVKQKEALPDYRVTVILNDGEWVKLGTKPDTSAAEGLTWQLSEPVSLAAITSVRLDDVDKVVSDTIAEVEFGSGVPVEEKGYRFEFTAERSFAVGVQSFFGTPVGQAIAVGLCLAILAVVLSAVNW